MGRHALSGVGVVAAAAVMMQSPADSFFSASARQPLALSQRNNVSAAGSTSSAGRRDRDSSRVCRGQLAPLQQQQQQRQQGVGLRRPTRWRFPCGLRGGHEHAGEGADVEMKSSIDPEASAVGSRSPASSTDSTDSTSSAGSASSSTSAQPSESERLAQKGSALPEAGTPRFLPLPLPTTPGYGGDSDSSGKRVVPRPDNRERAGFSLFRCDAYHCEREMVESGEISATAPATTQLRAAAQAGASKANMAKVIRKDLEAKLAALGGEEWDSMSEGSLSGDEDGGAQLDGELKPPPLPLRAQKKKKGARKEKGAGASVVPIGPAGEPSGVVYVGHIPHGFYEEAMNGFFKQFGDVIRVRISRSKKSARCKGYAYVEFTSPEVAGIVAETMNGYYLFDKQLVCRVLRFEEVHPNLFDGAGVKFRKVNWHGLYREKYNADRTPTKDEKHVAKLLRKDKARRAKLAALGIEYDFPGFVASLNDREVEARPFQGKKKRKSEGEGEDAAPSSKRRSAGGDAVVPAPTAQPDTTAPLPPAPSSSKKPKTKATDAASSKSKAKSPGKGTPTPSAKKAKTPSKVVKSPTAPKSAAGGLSGKERAAKTPPKKRHSPGGKGGEESAADDTATPLRTGTSAAAVVVGGKAKGSASKKEAKTPPPGGAKKGEGGKGKSSKSGGKKRSSQQADEGQGEGEGSAKRRSAKRARA